MSRHRGGRPGPPQRRPSTACFDDPWGLYFGGFHAFTADYAATINAAIGLSDGAPDFTGAVGVVRWF